MNLTSDQTDAITELVNIGVGRASASLNELFDFVVSLSVPSVRLVAAADVDWYLGATTDTPLAGVQMGFTGGFAGNATLVFPPESARHLISGLVGEQLDAGERDSVWVGTLTEVGNILLNGVMGTFSNALASPLQYDIPSYVEASVRDLIQMARWTSRNRPSSLVRASRSTSCPSKGTFSWSSKPSPSRRC